MCGIAGIVMTNNKAVELTDLSHLTNSIIQRGPDNQDIWLSENKKVGLVHTRLSIIDLDKRSNQPMIESNKYVIVFNGEVYNYKELKSFLISKGEVFDTCSDTEVILKLYKRYGRSLTDYLRGMFAFFIWDIEKQKGILVRDKFGIKPLYVLVQSDRVLFSSSVSSLEGFIKQNKTSVMANVGFYLWGFLPEPHTKYNEIHPLSPGTIREVTLNKISDPEVFFDLTKSIKKMEENPVLGSEDEVVDALKGVLLESIKLHTIADVPIALFLSAGLDSTTLANLIVESGLKNVSAITLGFEEFKDTPNDETKIAQKVAEKLGLTHDIVWFTKKECVVLREEYLRSMDVPTVDGLNTYFISFAAKKLGFKVAISGLGGDELFGGYSSFREIPKHVNSFKVLGSKMGMLGPLFRRLSKSIFLKLGKPKLAGIFEYSTSVSASYLLRRSLFAPWEIEKELSHEYTTEGLEGLDSQVVLDKIIHNSKNIFNQIRLLEICTYMQNQLLKDSDWASMANSVEIRVPFVDEKVIEFVLRLNHSQIGESKAIMYKMLKPEIVELTKNRKKTGFSTPFHNWLMEREGIVDPSLKKWARYIAKHKL